MEQKTNERKQQPFEYDLLMKAPANANSETAKWRSITAPFCRGIGLDLGAGGDPVVREAICCDRPEGSYNTVGRAPIQLPMDARNIDRVFLPGSLDYIYSSHLLEDFGPEEWKSIIKRWGWCIKRGGYMILVVPEVTLWAKAVARGQPPNLNHKHEFAFNELSGFFRELMFPEWLVVAETIPDPEDYSIIFAARRRVMD